MLVNELKVNSIGNKVTYIDIDSIAHEVLEDKELLKQIKPLMDYINIDDIIDYKYNLKNRTALGDIIYNNRHESNNGKKVVDIVWNKIKDKIAELASGMLANKNEIFVFDWILLHHTGYWNMCNCKIFMYTNNLSRRCNMLMNRDNIKGYDIIKRDKKTPKFTNTEFDFIIRNDYEGRDELESKLNPIYQFIFDKYTDITISRKKKAFYAGSFDPFTKGHMYIVDSAKDVFDVCIGIAHNPSKSKDRNIPILDMANIISNSYLNRTFYKNVSICIIEDGYIASNIAKDLGCEYLIRGIRNGIDYGYEENMAKFNKDVSGLDTVYFRAENDTISSTAAMLICKEAELKNNIPLYIYDYLDYDVVNYFFPDDKDE